MHDDFYQMYLEEMGDIAPCTKEEQAKLLADGAKGDESAKSRLIEGSLRLSLERAKEFEGKGILLIDLVQEANMALVLAVDEYIKSGLDTDFDEYTGESIRRALELAVEEELMADQTGEELTARVNVLQEVTRVMAKELGREATVEELADKMKMTVDEVTNIMKMAIDAMSLNAENTDVESLAELEEDFTLEEDSIDKV